MDKHPIGYACMTLGVPGTELKSCTLANATPERLHQLVMHNLDVLSRQMDYNAANRIKLFRISSDIIPFGSHPGIDFQWQELFNEQLKEIGAKIRKHGIRVSMHPGQYTVLNSPRDEVVHRSILDLNYHTRFLDALGADQSCKIILHGGGLYGDKKEAKRRFINQYQQLKDNVKARLVLENDEKCFSAADILELGKNVGAPVVWDNLHHALNPSGGKLGERQWIEAFADTWKQEDGHQKIHYSQQEPLGKPGAHAKSIEMNAFLDFYNTIRDLEVDVMLEVKDKNLSCIKCLNLIAKSPKMTDLEKEWARYKYSVLERSQGHYEAIRKLLKDKTKPVPFAFYELLQDVLQMEGDSGSHQNAVLHVWGYFKKIADESEKKRFMKLNEGYVQGKTGLKSIKDYLYKLTLKYHIDYLIQSYYFIL